MKLLILNFIKSKILQPESLHLLIEQNKLNLKMYFFYKCLIRYLIQCLVISKIMFLNFVRYILNRILNIYNRTFLKASLKAKMLTKN